MPYEKDIHLDLGSGDCPYEYTEGKTIMSDVYYDDVGGYAGESFDEPLMAIDAEHIPFRDESISRITSLAAMGVDTDLIESLEEAIRVLKPGGTFEISTYLWLDDARTLREFLKTQSIRNLYMRPTSSDWKVNLEDDTGNVPVWIIKFTKL